MMGPRGMLEQETSKPRNVGPTLRRLGGYFKPYWMVLLLVLVLLVGNAYIQVVTPQLTGQAFDCFVTPAITSAALSADAPAPAADAAPTAAQTNCTWETIPAGSDTAAYMAGLGRLVLWLVG